MVENGVMADEGLSWLIVGTTSWLRLSGKVDWERTHIRTYQMFSPVVRYIKQREYLRIFQLASETMSLHETSHLSGNIQVRPGQSITSKHTLDY